MLYRRLWTLGLPNNELQQYISEDRETLRSQETLYGSGESRRLYLQCLDVLERDLHISVVCLAPFGMMKLRGGARLACTSNTREQFIPVVWWVFSENHERDCGQWRKHHSICMENGTQGFSSFSPYPSSEIGITLPINQDYACWKEGNDSCCSWVHDQPQQGLPQGVSEWTKLCACFWCRSSPDVPYV